MATTLIDTRRFYKMYVHGTKRKAIVRELESLAGDNINNTSMKRLMARIARRQGRWRKRMANCHQRSGQANPQLPEAA